MHPILARTFGGLTTSYYLRNLLFGAMFGALFVWIAFAGAEHDGRSPVPMILWAVALTLLYPYSRFVYESIVEYVVGSNRFAFPAIIYLVAKLFTMMLCWTCAFFIAPVGLLWLYVVHSRAEAEPVDPQ